MLQNRTLCQGDNLPFLRTLPDESIHLIATDPPFQQEPRLLRQRQ